MKIGSRKRRRAAVVAIAALGLVGTAGVAVAGDGAASSRSGQLKDETPVGLGGTSETYLDMRDDGSYYDPSLGRRVHPLR